MTEHHQQSAADMSVAPRPAEREIYRKTAAATHQARPAIKGAIEE